MENIVQHKQGLNIKKIDKDSPNTSTNRPDTLINTSKEKQTENFKDKQERENGQNAIDAKAQENLKVNNILKGLVPFVEVKKEVVSDNGRTPKSNKMKNVLTKRLLRQQLRPSQYKEFKIKLNNDSQGINIERLTANSPAVDVRVVGDTTIQKLPNKNNSSQYFVYSNNSNSNNNNNGGSTNSSNNLSGICSKRTSLKGVPYGPLPASAFPKVSLANNTKSFQQNDAQPRAKKSFPQHSPPVEKLRPSNQQQNSTITQMSPPTTTTQHLEHKRAIAKNTMVTIPVDSMSINRTSTSSGTIIIGSIPVPPLTAVSKTMPSSLAPSTTTARNSPATFAVSGASVSSSATASHMVQAKPSTTISPTTSTTVRNSPITVTPSSPILATLTTSNTSSLLSTTPVATSITTSTSNPLSMTTPPPLAGLSNSSLAGVTQTSGITADPNNTTMISSLPAIQQPSADTHILGGLVTPTLASAITDVICRGPPKLAARPNGPLQSEGYPMFPSQAGPVCKRLVENVHKLEDSQLFHIHHDNHQQSGLELGLVTTMHFCSDV
ncbi:hypothetical protein EVAR_72490_1 [Eumeta japonica]|uniref:Uncharacterized protein n=1 Tax=Eumeta variegata TaxID=151549 RepID=A0A4C1TE29_EUMVA|nr:hypothetical protein EVAR_72490_1 [Eumeta japonica]